ncbi:hypothetical protein PDG61_11165 [Mycolicibacterium sp. BiH015]|uniref:hypothetical protein n=1 Tax=Mycolicibacterium sp. BiH015 TaxID=3018808 RepID=UPI0022E7C61E|nr:hypothetical protein [Mycolicibacterium sp. BiH015]MDA2891471.1 hypothetical protein [Mycolicibacterium sp. BiH015]
MAHSVFHRSITAGVALAGAGAIAFSTLPVLPNHEVAVARAAAVVQPAAAPRVLTAEVEYASLVQSLEILLSGAAGAVGQSFAAFSTQMPAIFRQVQEQWADPDLTPWNHSLIASAFFTPVAPLVVGPFTDAVAEVLAQTFPSRGDEIREKLPEAVEYAFARLIGPLISAIGATGAVHQQIYAAGMAGNAPGQWLALLRAPGTILDGFLNGGYGDISALLTGQAGGDRIAAPGLLTPWGEYPQDRSVTDDWDGIPSEETAQRTLADESEAETAADIVEVVEVAVSDGGDVAETDKAEATTSADTSVDENDSAVAGSDEEADKADEADKAERQTTKAGRADEADTTSEDASKDSGADGADGE